MNSTLSITIAEVQQFLIRRRSCAHLDDALEKSFLQTQDQLERSLTFMYENSKSQEQKELHRIREQARRDFDHQISKEVSRVWGLVEKDLEQKFEALADEVQTG